MIRLLYCTDCNSIDQLPPHVGRPEDDVVLERLIHDNHSHPVLGAHRGLMFTVPLRHWANENAKKLIIKQIREGLSDGLDELDEGYYEARDTMRESAMQCYQAHLRPKGQCPDWLDESKRILPPTKAERKDAGLPAPKDTPGVAIYVCQSCPVAVFNITKRREELGMYR